MYNDDMNNMMMPNDNNNYTNGSSDYNNGFGTNNTNNDNNYYGNEEFDVFGNSEPEKRSFNKKLLLIPVALVIIVIIVILLINSSNNKYTLKTKTISMKVKETEAIKIEAKDKVKKKITCSSKDSSIASVNSNCVVTGESVGNTIIYVGVNGKKTDKVTVKVDTNKEDLTFKEENITVKKDETHKLELTTVLEEDVFEWQSSNEDVATVNEIGVVTGVHAGTATISVREVNDGRNVSTRVTVESDEVLIESITIPTKTIAISEQVTLKPTIVPENGLSILKWESSNDSVVTVDENGVVTGIGNGEATVTVTTHNNKKGTAKIIVDGSLPSGVKITNCTGGISIGTPITLETELEPSDAKSTITWSSSNNSVATVSGGKVNAKNTGKVTITATTKNGKKDTCTLTAKAMDVSAISVSPNSVSLDQGSTRKISVSFNPSNAKNFYKVSWSTANSKIATVNSNGEVKGVNPGTTTITAKAGGRSAKVTVTVNASEVTKVTMSGCVSTAEVNQTMSLSAKVSPSSAKNKTITWKTSDSKIATVYSGKVTFKDVGTVTITASTSNGKKATCKISVKIPSITKLTSNYTKVNVKKGSSQTITISTNISLAQFKRYYGHLNYKVSNTGYIKVNSRTTENPLEIQITGLVVGTTTLTLGVGSKTVNITVTVTA